MPHMTRRSCCDTLRRGAVVAMLAAAAFSSLAPQAARAESSVTLGGVTLVNQGLVGVGRIDAELRDKFGETFGSGSGMAIDPKIVDARRRDSYSGTIYLLPDRGYNVERHHRLSLAAQQARGRASRRRPTRRQCRRTRASARSRRRLADTILLTDAAGEPLTGLDPAAGGIRAAADGFPPMPQAPNGHVALDAEAWCSLPRRQLLRQRRIRPLHLSLLRRKAGCSARSGRPTRSFRRRNGADHFSSNNPGPGAERADAGQSRHRPAEQPGLRRPGADAGRQISGRHPAERDAPGRRRRAGDAPITPASSITTSPTSINPVLVREHVVVLPAFMTADGKTPDRGAERDARARRDAFPAALPRQRQRLWPERRDLALSPHRADRHLQAATNIAGIALRRARSGRAEGQARSTASCRPRCATFIDINDNAELARFGLHNGPPQDRNDLGGEMGIAWASCRRSIRITRSDFFLFVANDNDFITQHGFHAGAPYKDASGVDLDTMFLVYPRDAARGRDTAGRPAPRRLDAPAERSTAWIGERFPQPDGGIGAACLFNLHRFGRPPNGGEDNVRLM